MDALMKHFLLVGLVASALALAACPTNYEDMTDAQRAAFSRSGHSYTFKPDPNAPVQVTYRIDDHRFVSLENYDRCYGDNYYNDTRLGIHQKVWTGVSTDYRGRLIIDDPSGANIVLPTASNSLCGDRGCRVPLLSSTDSGRTFNGLVYLNNSFDPSRDSENYTIAVTTTGLYVVKGHSDPYIVRYPMIRGFEYGSGRPLPGNSVIEFNAPMPSGLRTPSGQDRFTCDESIRPTNLSKSQ